MINAQKSKSPITIDCNGVELSAVYTTCRTFIIKEENA